jgi:hypothetical protein
MFEPSWGLLFQLFLHEVRNLLAMNLAVLAGPLDAFLGLLQTKFGRVEHPAIFKTGLGERLALGGSSGEARPGRC